jgi:pyruvate kinase
MRRTKIIGTIGPASESQERLQELIAAGLNLARLNLSHGTHQEQRQRIQYVRSISQELGIHVGIIADIQGPKIRLGELAEEQILLEEGQKIILTSQEVMGTAERITVRYPTLASDIKVGQQILIDDGLITLEVASIQGQDVHCLVNTGGSLSAHKGVSLPKIRVQLPAIMEKDRADIAFALKEGVEYLAISFVRKAEHLVEIKKLVKQLGGNASIIAKIENLEGVEQLDKIIAVADGVMVARGDLGVELPPEEVPLLQQSIVQKCRRAGKPVIIATQMLESMVHNPRPTRAEVNDVAYAVLQAVDAVMLSGETAVGHYPVEAVSTMAKVIERTESALNWGELLSKCETASTLSIADAISRATCESAFDLGAKAILSSTQSGSTARKVAKYRPRAVIIAATTNPLVARKLSLVWGVYPVVVPYAEDVDTMLDVVVDAALRSGLVQKGDLTAITGGVKTGIPGSTNLLKIHYLGEAKS